MKIGSPKRLPSTADPTVQQRFSPTKIFSSGKIRPPAPNPKKGKDRRERIALFSKDHFGGKSLLNFSTVREVRELEFRILLITRRDSWNLNILPVLESRMIIYQVVEDFEFFLLLNSPQFTSATGMRVAAKFLGGFLMFMDVLGYGTVKGNDGKLSQTVVRLC